MEEAAAKDFVKALGEMKNPPKTGKANAGQFSYEYAELPEILDLARPILLKHNFALTQDTATLDHLVGARTNLVHASGEEFSSSILWLPAGNTAQTAGSAITYARRYSLTAFLGLAGEEDDDGAAAGATDQPTAAAKPAAKPSPAKAEKSHDTDETKKNAQLNDMRVWLLEMSDGDLDMFADLLEMNTEFTNAKGELVHGRRDLKKLTDKQIPVVHHKLKEEYAQWKHPEVTE